MPWRLLPWTSIARRDGERAHRKTDRALTTLDVLIKQMNESLEQIKELKKEREGTHGRDAQPGHA